MSIKARFFISGFNKSVVSGGKRQALVTMTAVKRETDDNVSWAAYTPAGQIQMTVNEIEGGAYDVLEAALGKDVSITFDVIE